MNVRRFVSTSAQVDQGLGARNTSRIQGGFDDFWEYLELYEIEGERYISLQIAALSEWHIEWVYLVVLGEVLLKLCSVSCNDRQSSYNAGG